MLEVSESEDEAGQKKATYQNIDFFWQHFLAVVSNPRRSFWLVAGLFTVTYFIRLWQYGWAVNDDGILYLYTAIDYTASGFSAAQAIYDWPFYAILISWFDTVIPGGVKPAAWVFNYLLQVGQLYCVYRIALQLLRDRSLAVIASLLFIISICFFNFRHYIMRDQGFLLLTLASIHFAMAYVMEQRLRMFWLAIAASLLAVFFRIEALAVTLLYAFCLPLLLRHYRLLGLVVIGVACVWLVVGMGGGGKLFSDIAHFGQFVEGFELIQQQRAEVLRQGMLGSYWAEHAGRAVFLTYLALLLTQFFSSVKIYILALPLMMRQGWGKGAWVIVGVAATVFLYCYLFVLKQGFVVYRYHLLFTYLFTLVAICTAVRFYATRSSFLSRCLLGMFILIPLIQVLSPPSGSKRLLVEAQSISEDLGLAGRGVVSNAVQVSLMNQIDHELAFSRLHNPDQVRAVFAQPLKDGQAVIYLGHISDDLTIAAENCQFYRGVDRRRQVLLIAKRGAGCLPPINAEESAET